MAITVKLTDGTVQVGGDFQRALGFVKGFDGRKFDGPTKTWSVPVPVQEFRRRCSLPLDIVSGMQDRHVTRYGNVYDRNEWDAVKATPAAVAEATAPFDAQFETLEQELRSRVAALGFPTVAMNHLIAVIARFGLEDQEECGKIRYSSPERQQAVHAIYDWYSTEWNRIHDAERDAASMAQEDVLVRYGVTEPR